MRKNTVIWIASGIIAAFVAGTSTYVIHSRVGPLVSPSLAKRMNFVAYTPSHLPDGYHIDRASVKYDSGFLTYGIDTPLGRIIVTQQHQPADFKLEELGFQGMEDVQQFHIAQGKAATAVLQDRMVVFALTGQTMISMNGPVNLSRESMQILASSLR